MNIKRFQITSYNILFLFISNNIFSLSGVGYETITYIDQQHLSKKALANIQPLLSADEDLLSISMWPDQIRNKRPETKPWHYIDFPIRKDITIKDLSQFYNGYANLISQLEIKNPGIKKQKNRYQCEERESEVHHSFHG